MGFREGRSNYHLDASGGGSFVGLPLCPRDGNVSYGGGGEDDCKRGTGWGFEKLGWEVFRSTGIFLLKKGTSGCPCLGG